MGFRTVLATACVATFAGVTPVLAQQPAAAPHPGRDVLMGKCFQCHTDAMWRDQRQDRRGWESAIYRMVGRGGLWTADEIRVMADYLSTDFGLNTKPATPAR